MTESLQDLRDFLDSPRLTLPIGGREYVVAPCTATVWLWLQTTADDSEKAAAGDAEAKARASKVPDVDIYKASLGAAYDEMLEHVTGIELQKAGVTAWFWQLGQQQLAASYWASGGKAQAGTGDRTPPTSTSTGEATTTPTRVSGSGTKSRKKSSSS